MRTREHLRVALMDAGLKDDDARDVAGDAFDDDHPRQYFRSIVEQAMADLDREAIRVNALRAVRDKWIA